MPSHAASEARLVASTAELDRATAPELSEALDGLQALSGTPGERTLTQVRAQLAAFGAEHYEVQPMPPKGVKLATLQIRKWTAGQVEQCLGWLRRMNATGYDIYIRPVLVGTFMTHPLAFVDDIDQATVDRMRSDGLPFAVLNESSNGRFHGWVRMAAVPLLKEEVSAIGRLLAQRYGGDPGATDWRRYGRLAGTTNRKPSRATPRGAPYVMLRAASTDVAPGGAAILDEARARLEQEQEQQNRARAAQEARSADSFGGDAHALGDAATAFLDARRTVQTARAGDESSMDYGAAMSLLRRGFTREQVQAAMLSASPGLADRKKDPEGYAARTVGNAAARVAGTAPTNQTTPKL